jgi:hypothetical protein
VVYKLIGVTVAVLPNKIIIITLKMNKNLMMEPTMSLPAGLLKHNDCLPCQLLVRMIDVYIIKKVGNSFIIVNYVLS